MTNVNSLSNSAVHNPFCRSLDHRWQRGGNASNNCSVLAKCEEQCEFFGTMGDDFMSKFAKQDFENNDIFCKNIIFYNNCESPFSSVIINTQNGSRTIVHSNKNMPELNHKDFMNLELQTYKWIHFEGRNVEEVRLMIDHINKWNMTHSPITISVEFEKPRKELDALLPLADVVFVGKDFAAFQGCTNKYEALAKNILLVKPRSTVVVAWGESGAVAQTTDDGLVESPAAVLSEHAVDTLGAGDTFVAVTILCLSRGWTLEDSIIAGCKVAGAKVTRQGFSAVHPGLLEKNE